MKIVFDMPDGMELPSGKKEGDTVEFMSEFRIEKDGKLCLISVEDMPVGDYDDNKKKSGHTNFSDRVMAQLPPQTEYPG